MWVEKLPREPEGAQKTREAGRRERWGAGVPEAETAAGLARALGAAGQGSLGGFSAQSSRGGQRRNQISIRRPQEPRPEGQQGRRCRADVRPASASATPTHSLPLTLLSGRPPPASAFLRPNFGPSSLVTSHPPVNHLPARF